MTKIIKIISSVMLFSAISTYGAQALVPNVGPGSNTNVTWPTPRFIADTANCMVDQLTGLEWVTSPPVTKMSQTDAVVYINQNFNAGTGACGHTDWRLPNIAELKSLVNYSDTTSPASYLIDQGFTGVQTYYYWSSTAVGVAVGKGWLVDMSIGTVYNADTDINHYYVWPVRSGQ